MSAISGRIIRLSGAVALGALSAAAPALAGGFALREQSAVGQGMSFAGAAAGGGESLSGMFWNPAIVNQVEHFQGEQVVTGVFPSSKVDVTGGPLAAFGDGGDIGKNAALTSGYNAYRINEQLAVGLSISTPFGLATDPKSDWGGQIYGRSSRVRSINATPTIGYKVNDWFSIAGGVQIQWFDIRLRQASGPLPGDGSITLKGDDVGVGFTAGFTVTPSDWTSVGVGFRSSVSHKLDGSLFGPNSPVGLPADFKVKANVKLPETVTVGVRQKVSEDLTVLGGFEWTNWSRLGVVNVKAKGLGVTVTSLPFNYKDGYFVSGGLEYAFNPDVTLRGGVGYEWSPIDDRNRTVRLPDDDRWWFSAGGSYKYSEKLAFDLGYSFVYVPGKAKITVATPVPFSAEAKSDVHIVSASVRYKFGGDAPAALVTKY